MSASYNQIDQELESVGLADQCADLCDTGRLLKNVGLVRMQVMVNDYCPFVGLRKQFDTFNFNATTFEGMPASITSKIRLPAGGLEGIHNREVFILRSNLMFVAGSTTPDSLANGSTGSTTTTAVPSSSDDELVMPEHTIVAELWDNGLFQAKIGYEYVPFYAWTHVGSLFSNSVIEPSAYEGIGSGGSNGSVLPANTYGSSSGSSGKTTVNLAKWNYTTVNSPVTTQTSASSSSPDILFPRQAVSGVSGSKTGVHWSCQKRRPVFQGTDFFVIVRRGAPQSTNQTTINPLMKKYAALDSNLGNTAVPSAGKALNVDGALINAAMVDVDNNGNVVPDSRSQYDFNNQVYFIVEIGQDDPDNNYFIILVEKSNPIFVHVGTAPVVVTNPDGTSQVITPSTPVSRRLSAYEGASGADLLGQQELLIQVKNYFGQIVVIFGGYEDTPWIIERQDLTLSSIATPTGGGTTTNDNEDNANDDNPADFVESQVPMTVPNGNLALHGGNVTVSFNWGFQKYVQQVSLALPQTLQIEGTINTIPTQKDVNLFLQNISSNLRVVTSQNDAVYSHDALSFVETQAGAPNTTTAIQAQPVSYTLYGKGCVPAPVASGNNPSTPDDTGDDDTFVWPTQEVAIPASSMSSISVTIPKGMAPVANTGSRVQQFNVLVQLTSGNFTYPSDPEYMSDAPFMLTNVITPICRGYVLFVNARGCAFVPTSKDISYHVVSFNETWSAQDYVRIEHSGTLKLLINQGMSPTNAPIVDSQEDGTDPPATASVPDLSDYIASLHDKHFYVRLKAWYQGSGVFPNSSPDDNAYIFTGICTGSTLTYSANQRMMECHLDDLTNVLQKQIFVNSPFFDAVRDFVAVHEILHMASFQDSSTEACTGGVAPASFVLQGMNKGQVQDAFPITFQDGNANGPISNYVYCRSFALPGSYDVLQSPSFRFKDGDFYLDAIVKMANVAGKCVYFDRFGVFHYEDRVDALLSANQLTEQQVLRLAKENFYSTPQTMGCTGYGQVAYNSYTWQRLIGDVVNQIMVISAAPDGSLLVGGDKKYNLIDDPTQTGFIGYAKQFLQMNGVFGSSDAVKTVVANYTTMYNPPLHVSFETFGRSYLKALDIITFKGIDLTNNNNGNPQPLRILNISTEIEAAPKNTWWSKIDGEWLYPGSGVQWGTSDSSTD